MALRDGSSTVTVPCRQQGGDGVQEFPSCLPKGWSGRDLTHKHSWIRAWGGSSEQGEQEGAHTILFSEEEQTQAAVAGQDDGRRGL